MQGGVYIKQRLKKGQAVNKQGTSLISCLYCLSVGSLGVRGAVPDPIPDSLQCPFDLFLGFLKDFGALVKVGTSLYLWIGRN